MGTAPSVKADLAVLGGASPGTCKRGSDHRGFSKPPSWFCQPRCSVTPSSLPPWNPGILSSYVETVKTRDRCRVPRTSSLATYVPPTGYRGLSDALTLQVQVPE